MAGFSITRGKGFHVCFENGWTVSVQFGPGNYCDNYTQWTEDTKNDWESSTAEIAAWDANGEWFDLGAGDTVDGYQTPEQVLALLNKIAAL